MKSKRRGGETT